MVSWQSRSEAPIGFVVESQFRGFLKISRDSFARSVYGVGKAVGLAVSVGGAVGLGMKVAVNGSGVSLGSKVAVKGRTVIVKGSSVSVG